ncbi:Imm1 family immunity protein [Micromonospora sp. WMMD1102]|uniref:Imm1 family immunity protein n=1 Tax=Micromonospora sp. WMMD1102 TaxID=3016105 RepID=UPI00241579BC|nr:Imm1 family immunity protein [Micromonospora sp. WMMD1102]MDG4786666.1 Imm1 family immunity protein [Micromonospora sp. WMMD1102]
MIRPGQVKGWRAGGYLKAAMLRAAQFAKLRAEFSYGGQATDYHPAETRITPARAFEVVREIVGTGERPTTVDWDEQGAAPVDGGPVVADDPWA